MTRAQRDARLRTILRISKILSMLGYAPEVVKEQSTTHLVVVVDVEDDGPTHFICLESIVVKGARFVAVDINLGIQCVDARVISAIDDFFRESSWRLTRLESEVGARYSLTRSFDIAESWFRKQWLARVHFLMVDISGYLLVATQDVDLIVATSGDNDDFVLPGESGGDHAKDDNVLIH